jgi:hypothetical protein
MPAKPTKNKPSKAKATKPTPRKQAVKKIVKPERTDVFVSYSHADKKWLTRLQVHLKPLQRDYNINIWADTKLRGGDQWRVEIENALAKAKVAILLVSADFMGSDFIATDELPPLLQASQNEGVLILPVIVGDSGGFSISSLSKFQAMNNPSLPLNRMAEGQPDEVFAQLFKRVYQAFKETDAKSTTIGRLPTKTTKQEMVKPVASRSTVTLEPAKKASAKRPVNSTQKVNKSLLVKKTGEWSVVTVVRSELTDELAIVLKATDASQKVFLTTLSRQSNQLGSIVLNEHTYICRNTEIHVKTEGTQETWHLKSTLQPLNSRAEITYSGVSPNTVAESRIRLLLLNESPPSDHSYNRYFGSSMMMDFDVSPLPTLYHQLKKQETAFKAIVPLIATWYLQVNNLIEHILKLTFSLKGTQVTIRFSGQRSSQYQTDPMTTIKVDGVCDLSKSSDEKALLLGPISRY